MTTLAARFGLSLRIVSGPTAGVDTHDKTAWPHFAFDVELVHKGKPVLTTSYKFGIGYVDLRKESSKEGSAPLIVRNVLERWRARPHANFFEKQLQAEAAALLAKHQDVRPQLDDVVHSLLLDGAAYFDAIPFEEWAADLDYDPDSRKAEAIYKLCCEHGRAMTYALGRDVVERLRKRFEGY